MGVRIISDMATLNLMLERAGENKRGAALIEMDNKADELLQKAKDNAPVDKYNLENAIVRIPERPTGTRQQRGADGRFIAYSIKIEIKDTMIDPKTGKEVNTGLYGAIMHESDRAGFGSKENDAKRAEGKNPGRKFLERAYDEISPTTVPAMIAAVKGAV